MPEKKNLFDMSIASQRRHGYADSDGNTTDKGYERMTQVDQNKLDDGARALREAQQAADERAREERMLREKGKQ